MRAAGARIMLITDGDVAGVIATSQPDSGVDIYIGSGGAPEGVLAAAALRCIGGQIQGRLVFRNDDEQARAATHGHQPTSTANTSCTRWPAGDVMFAATGVTNGAMLRGVRRFPGGAVTHSIVMRSKTGTVRHDRGAAQLRRKPGFGPTPVSVTGATTAGLSRSVERSARAAAGAGWRAPATSGAPSLIAQRLGLPEIVGRAAGRARHRHRRTADAFLNPPLRALLPDPVVPERHGPRGRRGCAARDRGRRADRGLRRLRRRRRHLRRALLARFFAAAGPTVPSSTFPTG